jgi:two-component system, NarL family, nitrate/nitrite response regulator NarL
MENKIRVGIVDDHPLYRDGVVFALESEPDIEIVSQGETADDAFRIARDSAPDILLLDMNMPGGGLNAVTKISLRCSSTKTVMLTVVDDEDVIRSALRQGAQGYLLKGTTSSELARAIRVVNMGQNYVSPNFAAQLFKGRDDHVRPVEIKPKEFRELSRREEQILNLLVEGLSNRLIGNELGLTEKTVKGYVTAIMEKLNVRNRVEAAILAADLRGRNRSQYR